MKNIESYVEYIETKYTYIKTLYRLLRGKTISKYQATM
jgi:hypothetical protein